MHGGWSRGYRAAPLPRLAAPESHRVRSSRPRAMPARRTHENARRNRFDRTAVSRVLAALASANKRSEDFLLKRWSALRPLPGPPQALYIPTSAGRFRLSSSETVAGSWTFRQIARPFPSKPLSLCRSCWPLRARRNIGRASCGRKGLIHHFAERRRVLLALVHPLPTRVVDNLLLRRMSENNRSSIPDRPNRAPARGSWGKRGDFGPANQAVGAVASSSRWDSRHRAWTASSSPAIGGLTRPRTRTSEGR